MSAIEKLTPSELVRLDRDQIERLVVGLGPAQADKLVNQSLEELAVTLAKVQKAAQRNKLRDLQQGLHTLIRIGDAIGMPLLTRVAFDVLDVCTAEDAAAFSATLARLGRIGERSLIAVWDLQDMSL